MSREKKSEYNFALLATSALMAALNPTRSAEDCVKRADEIVTLVDRKTEEKFSDESKR